jgi:ABC-type branched-subunit amino acid transport system ATPase component
MNRRFGTDDGSGIFRIKEIHQEGMTILLIEQNANAGCT